MRQKFEVKMIYQTGTITTTAGQTKIKGTGTRWKDNLVGISEGCPISIFINNVVYFNNVLSVNSDTEINLAYPVPVAASAAKYQIATFVLDSMSDGVRKMLANQQYIQYFLRNMDAWLTQDGIVEIKTPTGETVKLESIIALKKLIDGKMAVGANGLGASPSGNTQPVTYKDADKLEANGFYAASGGDAINFAQLYSAILVMTRQGGSDNSGMVDQLQLGNGRLYGRSRTGMRWSGWMSPIYPGDFGIGLSPSEATNTPFLDNVNRTDLRSGRHRIGPTTSGTFPPNSNGYGGVLYHDVYGIHQATGRVYCTQVLLRYSDKDDQTARRSFDPIANSWTQWKEIQRVGDFGIGGSGIVMNDATDAGIAEFLKTKPTQFWRNQSTTKWNDIYSPNMLMRVSDTFANICVSYLTGKITVSSGLVSQNDSLYKVSTVYTTLNTTKDANGNLKAASPVIKVFSDHAETNDESEGVEVEKLDIGRYKLKGTLGMNSDASWGGIHGGLVVPNGINNLPLVWADFDVLPDGDIIIETRYRKHTLHPRLEAQRLMTYPEFLDENNVEREDYDYCDIPNGHWIDVRVNMPSDSIYNQKLAEAERLAKIEAERVAKEEAEKAAREEAERLEEESKQE
ncbi:TPA: hypothetical protein ACS70L_003494 [Providencia alcalifaciens]